MFICPTVPELRFINIVLLHLLNDKGRTDIHTLVTVKLRSKIKATLPGTLGVHPGELKLVVLDKV